MSESTGNWASELLINRIRYWRIAQAEMLHRILKMLGALFAGMGLTIITQLLLPPALLHFYGVDRYGEWLVLSGTLGYLSTLNFGISTYASNELTMLHKRGETLMYRQLQGSTLALSLGMIWIGVLVSALVFFIPIARLLHLSTMSQSEVALTSFFLGLQTMVAIIAGYYNSLFMVIEEAHRGLTWGNLRFFGGTVAAVGLAIFRVPFSTLAIGQFVMVLLLTLLSVYDLKHRMGDLPLGLQGANWKTAKSTLAPSGMFGMIFAQQFLIFQAPLIMLQWIVGPSVVVVFSTSRTILSTARQSLAKVTNAIAPEITLSYAHQNMKRLLNIFHYSEKVVFAGIPIANLGAFLLAPVLLQVWLRRPSMFDTYTYGLMALISGAMSMRDHKQYFQFSTNKHKRLSIIVFFGNLLMITLSIPFTIKLGLNGFLYMWLASELAQMGLIYFENKKLFHDDPSISMIPVLKLGAVMAVSLPICAAMLSVARERSLVTVAVVATVGIVGLTVESYLVFGLKDVWDELRARVRDRAIGIT
jgi:O-antigen/teichoic acid export membrane protein